MTVTTLPGLLTAAAFLAALLAAGLEDLKHMEIRNRWPAVILLLAGLACLTMPETPPADRVWGFFAASVPMYLITVARPGAFGGGDIRLTAASGAFLGRELILPAVALALFAGALPGLFLLIKKRESKCCFPFGPCLCFGMLFSLYADLSLSSAWRNWLV